MEIENEEEKLEEENEKGNYLIFNPNDIYNNYYGFQKIMKNKYPFTLKNFSNNTQNNQDIVQKENYGKELNQTKLYKEKY